MFRACGKNGEGRLIKRVYRANVDGSRGPQRREID